MDKTLPQVIKRKTINIGVGDLAKELDCHYSHLSRILNCKRPAGTALQHRLEAYGYSFNAAGYVVNGRSKVYLQGKQE